MFLKNQERSGQTCKQVTARIGNVKKSLASSKSKYLLSNLVSSLDQSSTMAPVSAKLFVKKIKANHEQRKTRYSRARFGSTTQRKTNQKSKSLKGEKAFCMHVEMIEILI